MKLHKTLAIGWLALSAAALPVLAQDAPAAPQITMGNGEANAIMMDGLSLSAGPTVFSEVRVDDSAVKTFRAHSTAVDLL